MAVSLFGRDAQNNIKEALYGGLYSNEHIGSEQEVDSIQKRNTDYRNSAVKNIWAKYNMLPNDLTYSMNRLMNVIQDVYLPPKDMKSLYEYTHDGLSEYSRSIDNKYLKAGKYENTRVNIQTTNTNVVPWRERYGYSTKYGVGDRDKALAFKKEGKTQDGKYDPTNEEQKNWKELKGDRKARKEIRKSLRKQRKESKKQGTWYNYETVDSTYSTYAKTNRSADWIKTNLSESGGTIGEYIKHKYRSYDSRYIYTDRFDIDENVYYDGSDGIGTYNLKQFSVINSKNGLVDIIGRQRSWNKTSQKELKRCMFSITNLATRSSTNPIGTVMWFPPYDLNFQESVSVQWDEKTFVGRGEPIYTYVNTVRNGTLSFTLLIDHPTIINDIVKFPKNENDDILRFFNGGSDEPIKIGKYADDYYRTPYIQSEYEFFKNLEKDDNVAFKKIKDRLKFFHPAYHSMTPEGFNMRLNFLHQCTRQGATVDDYAEVRNTVFGRPPFCELRIGDFINTRICINTMSITYESSGGMTWDLNPEGIGVQPMLAKVSLGIHILGGQSLSGPVLSLCNAVSNDFYANGGVYASDTDHVVTGSNDAFNDKEQEQDILLKKYESEKKEKEQTLFSLEYDKKNMEKYINMKGEIENINQELKELEDKITNGWFDDEEEYYDALGRKEFLKDELRKINEANPGELEYINGEIKTVNTEINNLKNIIDYYKG